VGWIHACHLVSDLLDHIPMLLAFMTGLHHTLRTTNIPAITPTTRLRGAVYLHTRHFSHCIRTDHLRHVDLRQWRLPRTRQDCRHHTPAPARTIYHHLRFGFQRVAALPYTPHTMRYYHSQTPRLDMVLDRTYRLARTYTCQLPAPQNEPPHRADETTRDRHDG